MSDYFTKSRNRRIDERINHAAKVPIKKSSRWEFLRHPLMSLVTGFVLTAFVGSYLTNSYQEKKEDYDLRLKTIEDFTNMIFARRTTAVLLNSAIKRNAGKEEALLKKHDYDKAYLEWNIKLQTTLFGIRRLSGLSSIRSQFEPMIENQLRGSFAALDKCITDEYDTYIGTQAKRQFECDTDNLLKSALACSTAMSNQLYRFFTVYLAKSDTDKDKFLKSANLEIIKNCAVSEIQTKMSEP
jgi:hypothetical protein